MGEISITFRLRSPIFNDVPSHSLDFDLPGTPHNHALTGYLHRPGSQGTSTNIPVILDVHGWQFGATLKVMQATAKSISVYMAIDNGQMNIDWGDTKLTEFPFEKIPFYSGQGFLNEYNKDKDSAGAVCAFPQLYCPKFYDEKEPEFTGFINSYNLDEQEYTINVPDTVTGIPRHNTATVPMFYLLHIVKWICEKHNIIFNRNFFTRNEFKRLILFNNHSIETKRRKNYFRASSTLQQQFFSTVGKLAFTDTTTVPNDNTEGVYNATLSEYNVTHQGLHEFVIALDVNYASGQFSELVIHDQAFSLNTGSNFVRYSKVFYPYDIGTKISVTVSSFDIVNGHRQYRTIFVTAGAYFSGRNVSLSNLGQLYLDYLIDPALHMPDIKIKELFESLFAGFGIIPIFKSSTRTLTFYLLKEIIQKPASRDLTLIENPQSAPEGSDGFSFGFDTSGDDIPKILDITGYQYIGDYPSANDLPFPMTNNLLAYIKGSGSFYIYTYDDTISNYRWQPFADYLASMKTGKAETEITVKWHPPAMTDQDQAAFYPAVGCKGSSDYFEMGRNRPPFVLLHYYGMQPAYTSTQNPTYIFPFAGGIVYDNLGNQIGNLHLGFDTPAGLYETFWKPVEEFYRMRWRLKGNREIDANFLRDIDWATKYLYASREYLLDNIEFTATQSGFTKAKVEAWRT